MTLLLCARQLRQEYLSFPCSIDCMYPLIITQSKRLGGTIGILTIK